MKIVGEFLFVDFQGNRIDAISGEFVAGSGLTLLVRLSFSGLCPTRNTLLKVSLLMQQISAPVS
jgi:hypothetical protein